MKNSIFFVRTNNNIRYDEYTKINTEKKKDERLEQKSNKTDRRNGVGKDAIGGNTFACTSTYDSHLDYCIFIIHC